MGSRRRKRSSSHLKRVVGTTPGNYGKSNLNYTFGKVNLLETNFEVTRRAAKKQISGDKRVLTNLPKNTGSFILGAFGEFPEGDGDAVIKEWAKKNNLLDPDKGDSNFWI